MRSWDFTLPLRTPSNNQLLRMHWSKRRKLKKWIANEVLVALAISGQQRPPEPLGRVRITVERGSCRKLDEDNLHGGTKPLFDVLERVSRTNPHGLGLIENDSAECVVEREVVQVHTKPRGGYTRVHIEEI